MNKRTVEPVEKPKQIQKTRKPRLIEASELIRATEARSLHNVTGNGLTVAVIDTGLRKTHVDFTGRIIAEHNFTKSNNNQNDATDDHGHGTNVTGIIAANADHTGIAPGANIIALKVLDKDGSGSFDEIKAALQWVINSYNIYNITVVNMSLGDGQNYSNTPSDPMNEMIKTLRNAGIAVVVSAGNSFFNCNSKQGMGYPAIVAESISVGAVYDSNQGKFTYGSGAKAYSTGPDRITPFSQRLHETSNPASKTDIFAPGAPITSSGYTDDHGESIQHGTSQASPVVSGVILLMQELYKREHKVLPTVDLLEQIMQTSGTPIKDGDDEDDNVKNTGLYFTRIDALNALNTIHAPEPPQIHQLTINKLKIKINFKQDTNNCTLKASLSLPNNFNPKGATIILYIGNMMFPFILNTKGHSKTSNGSFYLKTEGRPLFWSGWKKSNVGDLDIQLENIKSLWPTLGLTNETVNNKKVTIPIKLKLMSIIYGNDRTLYYSAKKDKNGEAE
jgi:hypothetical protein